MILSQYLQNVMSNFPIEHHMSKLASAQLHEVLCAESRRDGPFLIAKCREWDIDPIYLDTLYYI